jgi:hypothetical protein
LPSLTRDLPRHAIGNVVGVRVVACAAGSQGFDKHAAFGLDELPLDHALEAGFQGQSVLGL